jgi:hypothetical protein
MSKFTYVLLDFDNKPIRYYDYPATGSIKIEIPPKSIDELYIELGDCLF